MPGALFDAVRRARFKQVALLLNKRANINVRDDRGGSLLMAALRIDNEQKRARMFEYLLKRGAPCLVRDADGRGALEWAVKLERADQVKVILDEALVDYDLAQRDADGYTALHYAAMSGNVDVVRLVADAHRRQGVGVDVTDAMGLTPLMHAQRLALADVVAVLTRAGGNVGRSDFTYHLNMREWELRGQAEQVVARQRAALKEVSRLKMLGKLGEASQRLLRLRLDGAAPQPAAAAVAARGGGWRVPPLGDQNASASSGLDATLSPEASSSVGGVDIPLASSWPPLRLAKGFVSFRSLASDSTSSSSCLAEPTSATAIGVLPTILEAYGYQKTGSYRSPAVVALLTGAPRQSKSPAKAAAAAGLKTQGKAGGDSSAATVNGRRYAAAGGDEFKTQLPSLSELPERQAAQQQQQSVAFRPAAAAEQVRVDA